MLALPVAEGHQPVRQIRMVIEMPVQAVRDTSVLVEEVVLALAECLKVADVDLRIDLSTKEEFQQELNYGVKGGRGGGTDWAREPQARPDW